MCLFTAMADCCSSSEKEHAILLGALAVLQQIDERKNEETKKIVGAPMDCLKIYFHSHFLPIRP